jgi:acyl-CoA reductase-like NAD-dependent aldehyde dehydrogenase
VFKPSELTTGTGQWLVQSFTEVLSEVFGDTEPVLQLVTGLGATGAELAKADVDKIAFTGSAATARRVLAAAAEKLTPVLTECGGKDALLVAADADLDAAVDAAAWGAMSNAGQTCIGVERVYVAEPVYRSFLEKLNEKVSKLRPGEDDGAAYGPMTLPGQVDVVERHLADAVARGGRAAHGGLDSVQAPYVHPVVLVDVPAESAAVREETFGPVVTVTAVPSMTEAVRLANASPYALGSAVFTKRRRAGLRAARSLRAGMTSVNSVITFAAVPSLPFGGSGESGFGRIHGADGLREFSRAKAITRQRMPPPVRTTTFRRTSRDTERIVKLVTVLHGRLYQAKRHGRRKRA